MRTFSSFTEYVNLSISTLCEPLLHLQNMLTSLFLFYVNLSTLCSPPLHLIWFENVELIQAKLRKQQKENKEVSLRTSRTFAREIKVAKKKKN